VTNIVITSVEDNVTVHTRSKGIGVNTDGTAGSVTYDDVIQKHNDEWRIVSRKIFVRRRPLSSK
jgi:hypothetical protein